MVDSNIFRIFVEINIMTTEEQIEEILHEASAYGLRVEVMETAKQYMEEEGMDRLLAYENAYHEWIK